jgi:hypothetical protein
MNMSNEELEQLLSEVTDRNVDLQQKLLASQASEARLRESLKLFKKEAESYGEAWARCYVADFDRIAVDSKKVRFDLLAIQQDRLKSFADALLSTPPNTAELAAYVESEIEKRLGEPVAWNISTKDSYSRIGCIYRENKDAINHVKSYETSPIIQDDPLHIISLYARKDKQ